MSYHQVTYPPGLVQFGNGLWLLIPHFWFNAFSSAKKKNIIMFSIFDYPSVFGVPHKKRAQPSFPSPTCHENNNNNESIWIKKSKTDLMIVICPRNQTGSNDNWYNRFNIFCLTANKIDYNHRDCFWENKYK